MPSGSWEKSKEKALLKNKTHLIALDSAPFLESFHLLGTSSTAYTVRHVLDTVAKIPAGKAITLVGEVDDVAQLAALLEPRITRIVVAGDPFSPVPKQPYRWSGIVPGLSIGASRENIIELLSPRNVNIDPPFFRKAE